MPIVPATEEVIEGSWFKVSPGKKFIRTYLKNNLGMVVNHYNSSYSGKKVEHDSSGRVLVRRPQVQSPEPANNKNMFMASVFAFVICSA
jgi:hypothetical protein